MAAQKMRFTPEYRLRALDALASSADLEGTAQAFGIRPRTLAGWWRQRQQIAAQVQFDHHTDDLQQAMILRFDMLTRQLVESLPSKIENAKLNDTVRAIFLIRELEQAFSASQEPASQQRTSPFREKLAHLIEHYTAEAQPSGAFPSEDDADDLPDAELA